MACGCQEEAMGVCSFVEATRRWVVDETAKLSPTCCTNCGLGDIMPKAPLTITGMFTAPGGWPSANSSTVLQIHVSTKLPTGG
jgi:hypothetical protein